MSSSLSRVLPNLSNNSNHTNKSKSKPMPMWSQGLSTPMGRSLSYPARCISPKCCWICWMSCKEFLEHSKLACIIPHTNKQLNSATCSRTIDPSPNSRTSSGKNKMKKCRKCSKQWKDKNEYYIEFLKCYLLYCVSKYIKSYNQIFIYFSSPHVLVEGFHCCVGVEEGGWWGRMESHLGGISFETLLGLWGWHSGDWLIMAIAVAKINHFFWQLTFNFPCPFWWLFVFYLGLFWEEGSCYLLFFCWIVKNLLDSDKILQMSKIFLYFLPVYFKDKTISLQTIQVSHIAFNRLFCLLLFIIGIVLYHFLQQTVVFMTNRFAGKGTILLWK